MDPHHFRKSDPDPHCSEKRDPDPHHGEKRDLDLHHSIMRIHNTVTAVQCQVRISGQDYKYM